MKLSGRTLLSGFGQVLEDLDRPRVLSEKPSGMPGNDIRYPESFAPRWRPDPPPPGVFTTVPRQVRDAPKRPTAFGPDEDGDVQPQHRLTGHAQVALGGPDNGQVRPLWSPDDPQAEDGGAPRPAKAAGADAGIVDENDPKGWTDPDRPMPVPKRLLGTAEYYKFRALDFKRRNPDKDPPDYYLNFGDKYARKFTNETFDKLSDKGKAWDLSARQKLQEKMEGILHDPRNAGIEHRPEELKDKAFDSHSDAYLEAGITGLGVEDVWEIGKTGFRDLFNSKALKEAGQVFVPYANQKIQDKVDERMRNMDSYLGE